MLRVGSSKDYPLIFSRIEGRKPNFEVYDFSGYLLNKVKLDWKLFDLDLEVTYHDSCHLNRGQGIHEQPRQLINAIPGVKLVEMEEPDRCCGAGGVIVDGIIVGAQSIGKVEDMGVLLPLLRKGYGLDKLKKNDRESRVSFAFSLVLLR